MLNKKPKKVKEASARPRERPLGSKNQDARTNKKLLTSSMTLASGSVEHRGPDLDEGDNDAGLLLPPQDVVPRVRARKLGSVLLSLRHCTAKTMVSIL